MAWGIRLDVEPIFLSSMSPSHIAMQMNGNLNHRQETKVSEMNKTMFTKVSNFGHHRNPYHDDHVKKVGTIRLPILPIYCLYIADI